MRDAHPSARLGEAPRPIEFQPNPPLSGGALPGGALDDEVIGCRCCHFRCLRAPQRIQPCVDLLERSRKPPEPPIRLGMLRGTFDQRGELALEQTLIALGLSGDGLGLLADSFEAPTQ